MKPRWRPIDLWHLSLAVNRQAVHWWHDPRTGRYLLRSRAGRLYDVSHAAGLRLRERREFLDL